MSIFRIFLGSGLGGSARSDTSGFGIHHSGVTFPGRTWRVNSVHFNPTKGL
jgi:hypothetical protein